MRTRLVVSALLACVAIGCSPASLLPVGSTAPDRVLRDQSGVERSLEAFRGRPVVVFFYPRDGTPGCTREACAFRDAWDRYVAAGVQVVGVSNDDVASHAEFVREHTLPFPLLADTESRLAHAFGVPERLGMLSRVTFVLDGQGIVRAVYRDVDPGVHADEVLGAIARLGIAAPEPANP